MAGATPLYDKICRENREYERQVDLKNGIIDGPDWGHARRIQEFVALLFEQCLSRALTESERATFAARYAALGHDRLSELLINFDGPTLAGWLASPAAR